MCVSLSNAGVIFWAIGIVIAFGGGLLMDAAHKENARRAQGDGEARDL